MLSPHIFGIFCPELEAYKKDKFVFHLEPIFGNNTGAYSIKLNGFVIYRSVITGGGRNSEHAFFVNTPKFAVNYREMVVTYGEKSFMKQIPDVVNFTQLFGERKPFV